MSGETLGCPPGPFLRWAGGKRKLLSTITEAFPSDFDSSKDKLYEPFVGGGALALSLGNPKHKHFVPGKNLFINDINPDLITTYKVVRDDVEKLIIELGKMSQDISREKFLDVRCSSPRTDVKRAARFIYLNKTCFNGLWRVNSKGHFNVPWGNLKNPNILTSDLLRASSARLQDATITNAPFPTAVESVSSNDLVYLDPPYVPLSDSANFSKYAKEDFGILDHFALAGVIKGLTSRGARVILSNSDTELSRDIFGSTLHLYQLPVQRNIGASAASRKVVQEILGVSYQIPIIAGLKRI